MSGLPIIASASKYAGLVTPAIPFAISACIPYVVLSHQTQGEPTSTPTNPNTFGIVSGAGVVNTYIPSYPLLFTFAAFVKPSVNPACTYTSLFPYKSR